MYRKVAELVQSSHTHTLFTHEGRNVMTNVHHRGIFLRTEHWSITIKYRFHMDYPRFSTNIFFSGPGSNVAYDMAMHSSRF